LEENVYRWTAADPSLRWFTQNGAGLEVQFEDISESIAALALQGPTSGRLLQTIVEDADIGNLKYFRVTKGTIAGVSVEISRTGYTGDLGFEIWVESADALALWDALLAAGAPYGLMPAGMLALDMARIEAGLMLIDVDYVPARKALIDSQTSSPYELDLAWTVRLDKERFVGREALAAERARGPQWQFVGIELDWDSLERLYAGVGLATRLPAAAWRMSVPIYAGAEQAGYATSGGWSPLLKKYIALAHLRAPHAAPGTALEMEITVEHRRKRAAASVVKKPFFDPPRKKA
jgi:aminomethyltransferase